MCHGVGDMLQSMGAVFEQKGSLLGMDDYYTSGQDGLETQGLRYLWVHDLVAGIANVDLHDGTLVYLLMMSSHPAWPGRVSAWQELKREAESSITTR